MNPQALTTTKLNEEEKQWIQKNDQLIKVGYLEGFQPLSYNDADGNFKGIAADLLNEMGQKYADEDVQFEVVGFQEYEDMISALKNKTISAAWMVYGDYWNADQNGFALTNKVLTTSMMLVFDGKYTAETVQKIGVNRAGSLAEIYATINFPDSEIAEYNSYEEAVAALTRGDVTSILYTPYATIIYNEELERELNDKQQVINEMQLAINQEQFNVYLQPKYSLRNNKMVGAEALVRWIHPTKGLISPAKFIPVFESNGFITELDRYMWEHVCKLLSKWKKEGRTIVPVSVNVSRLSMYGASTVDYLKNLVKKYDIDPKYLELELTKSAYIGFCQSIHPTADLSVVERAVTPFL